MILVVGQNSVWQKTYQLENLTRARVNRIESVFESPAGKGSNVCRVLAGVGADAELHAYVGGTNGSRFETACSRDGFGLRFTHISAETRICTTLIERDTTMTELVEPAPQIEEPERLAFERRFMERVSRASFLVIAGTAVRGEAEECFESFVAEGRRNGVVAILDSYRSHGKRALAAAPEVLKINRDELAELSGREVSDAEARKSACRDLLERHRLRWIIITGGPTGAEGFSEGSALTVRPPQVTSVNPIGSGDAVTAGVVSVLSAAKEEDSPATRDDASRSGAEATDAGVESGTGRRSGAAAVDWGSSELLSEAVANGVALGTANCLNIRPGYIEANDLAWVRGRISIEEM